MPAVPLPRPAVATPASSSCGRRRCPARPARATAPGSSESGGPAPAPSCAKCGVALADAPKGCVEGRIAGGIGAAPGFGWWPIKAYRPCPALEASGRGYTRKGQITNEMLFGRKGTGPPPPPSPPPAP